MKTIYESAVGGDGAKVGAYVEADQLTVKASYPIAKILTPVNTVLDSAFAKLEAVIPGDWDKAILEPIRVEAEAELLSLLVEAPVAPVA